MSNSNKLAFELGSIQKYKILEKLRDNLRTIQKLSWRITQFDKKFSLETVEEKNYPELLKAYFEFGEEIKVLADLWNNSDENFTS